MSMPRTFNHISFLGTISAVCMGISILLCLIYAGTEGHPGGNGSGLPEGTYPALGEVKTFGGFPKKDLGFVEGFNAVLNITVSSSPCPPSPWRRN